MNTKQCPKCGVTKLVVLFHKNTRSKDGLMGRCKPCAAEYDRKWRAANPEKKSEYARKYYAENAAGISEYKRKLRAASPEKHLERDRKNRVNNYVKISQYDRKRRAESPEKYAARLAANNAIARGDLIRPSSCSVCASTSRIEAHHDSYLPEHQLVVRWLCAKCHAEHHRKYP